MYTGDTWNIWDILGIEPSADVKAIRAAYSEKVREYHPEDDPEGFMRLRSAYKMAIQISSANFDRPAAPYYKEHEAQAEAVTQNQYIGPPEFDFSNVDNHAADLISTEKRMVDKFIAELVVLRDSEKYNNPKAWEAMLKSPALGAIKHSEYFAKAFLQFRTGCIRANIPFEIHTRVFTPLIDELRGYWPGTALSGEFNAIWRSIISSNKFKAAERPRRLQSYSLYISAITGFIFFMVFRFTTSVDNTNTAISYFSEQYHMYLGEAIMLVVTAALCIAINIFCFRKVREIVRNEEYSTMKIRSSKNSLILHSIVVLVILIVLFQLAFEIPRWSKDLVQIREERITTVSVTINSNDLSSKYYRWIDVDTDSGYRRLTIMPGAKIDPGSGSSKFNIAYTENLGIVISITAIP